MNTANFYNNENIYSFKDKTIEILTDELKEARQRVNLANQHKLDIELEIYELISDQLKETGTTNFDSGLKVQTSIEYKIDQEKLNSILEKIELPFEVFKLERKVSVPRMRELQEAYPEYFRIISEAITARPTKPYMTVKEQ